MTMAICCCISVLASFYVSAVYQAKVILSIPSTYFKNPVVSDVIPEVSDTSELETMKRSIYKRALSDDFIDALGEKFGFFEYALDDARHVQERKKLQASIRYLPLTTSTFQVSATADNASAVQGVLLDVADKIRFVLIEERYALFTQARNALESELLSLSARSSAQQQAALADLEKEFAELNVTIQELREKYTESHPDLYKMKKRAEELRAEIHGDAAAHVTPTADDPAARKENANVSAIYTELARKLSYLNVALSIEKGKKSISFLNIVEEPEIPSSPIYPRALSFLQYGFGIGLLAVLAQTIFLEARRSLFYEPEQIAELLNVPFYGRLPSLPKQEWQFLVEQVEMIRAQKLLPPPLAE